ncbi:hypothetical protein [Massilia pseudoviolaceinigra]|uniref:hypothetical protein n=1 Tax=Massilia pseudoviolaceinigra TaxID=3057165 RepID=UPI002796C9CB|nr:hypothetical protein [Massilia sp. CCM 9206]MDQ1923144.1 hypothetical protein [Massilia sp. CCM 9206]
MNANDGCETVLLLNQQEQTVHPHSSDAFKLSSGSKHKLLRRHLGTLVVYRDGSVSRIEGIQFCELDGKTIVGKVLSFFNGPWRRIAVTLRPLPDFPFEEVRRLVAEYIRRHPESLGYLEDSEKPELVRQPEKMAELVERSSDCAELFTVLCVPRPEDALDLLGDF